MRDHSKWVIWPEYLDARRSRKEGRRVPLNLAVPKPTIKEIIKSAKMLDLNPVYVEDKRYPKNWWASKGLVLVDKKAPKEKILKLIAQKIRELRST